MRPYIHPKDEGLKFQRKVGKRRKTPDWKRAAVAKAAPHELDASPEADIRAQIIADIEDTGLPYLTLEDADLFWLKREAAKGSHNAMRLLAALKDLPDVNVWRPAPGMPYALALPLELKVTGKTGRPGQRNFRDAAGGFITAGYTPAAAALRAFLSAPNPSLPPTPHTTETP